MFLAYVVRLLPEPLARGVFSGVVEVVDSRRRYAFEDLDGLVEVLRTGGNDDQAMAHPLHATGALREHDRTSD